MGLTPVSLAASPGKLHLRSGLFGCLLAAGLLGRGLLRRALILSEGRSGEAENESEAEGDGHEFLHLLFLLKIRRQIRL